MQQDPIADALSKINNAERARKLQLELFPVSKLLISILELMKSHGYIKDFKHIPDHRGGVIQLELAGKINACGAICPRMNVKLKYLEKYEKRYLPARDLGILILSTPKGLMTHTQARQIGHGGVLIAYVY